MKPLGRKAYGSIGHLPMSRMGSGDHSVPEGYARICCEKARDKHDTVIVQEKLDGSCCAVAKLNGEIIPLGRAGWPAITSPYKQHRLFHGWVLGNWQRFYDLLEDGERIVGEWLAQAHGTRYALKHEPFVAFDIMREDQRLPWQQFYERAFGAGLITPTVYGFGPVPVQEALRRFQERNSHGAIDPIEGVVYRVERAFSGRNKVDFLAKYVRPDKVDGAYLPEVSGKDPIWNWQPESAGQNQ